MFDDYTTKKIARMLLIRAIGMMILGGLVGFLLSQLIMWLAGR